MRKILVICISFVFWGCSLNYDTSYFIENKSIDTISLRFFNQNLDTISLKIPPNNNYLFLRTVGFGFAPSKMSLNYNDSIFVSKKNKSVKFYRDIDQPNQIYVIENWKLTRAMKSVYEYTYTFDESSFE